MVECLPRRPLRQWLSIAVYFGVSLLAFSSSWALEKKAATTISMPPEAESLGPAIGFSTEDRFPGLTFENPVAVASAPGETDRLFVVERAGRIYVITNLALPSKTLFLDIVERTESKYQQEGAEGLTSLAFHPIYAQNGQFFVTYSTDTTSSMGTGNHNRLSRFQVRADDPSSADPGSEAIFINQYDEGYGHNMNDVKFGPDGYLYIAVGDEGESHDAFQNSQRIDKDFFSGILRIDVDKQRGSFKPTPHPASSTHYLIPPDNPFLGAESLITMPVNQETLRGEFWAVGFRNPWRIWIDSLTGWVFTGDVGQHVAEEIDLVRKGGNYGWSFKEANQPGFRGDPPLGVSFDQPLIAYRHGVEKDQGNSVTGGVLFRGRRLPGLDGAYIFGDFVSGHIWWTKYDGETATPKQWLTTDPGIAGFGLDPRNSDVLLVDHDEGKVKRLVTRETQVNPLPTTLAETGLFKNVETLAPEEGVVPYGLNVPFWSGGALKERWFAVRNAQDTIGFNEDAPWTFPTGMVWVKHFELPLDERNPGLRRRLETRVVVKQEEGVYGATYRWNEAGDGAVLVGDEGMNEEIEITNRNGVRETVVWRYPSRGECLACHTGAAGYALGFGTEQLNRDFDHGSGEANQLATLSAAGYLDTPVEHPRLMRRLAALEEDAFSETFRVRSYLAANCANCHQPGGTAQGSWDARITTPLSEASLLNGPVVDSHGDAEARVIYPGRPSKSVLLDRISRTDEKRMPRFGTARVDERFVQFLTEWIEGEADEYETYPKWQIQHFGGDTSADSGKEADPDGDKASNWMEWMARADPLDESSHSRITVEQINDAARVRFEQLKNRWTQVEVTESLAHPDWSSVVDAKNHFIIPSQDSSVVMDIDITELERGFYRLRIGEP